MKLYIKCQKNHAFAVCLKEHIDLEWKEEELYYQKQGCSVIESELMKLTHCDCKEIKHEFSN